MQKLTEYIHMIMHNSRAGNIALGVLFVFIGILGFALLKMSERRKNNR
ncbi:MAG: hypothetical protein IIZ59_02415 [Clostridia bacterium]|nr:hypothetical protein [Clostridia bacterium]